MKKLFILGLALVWCSSSYAQTIDALGSAGALAGSENVPIFQTANPAVKTTTGAIGNAGALTGDITKSVGSGVTTYNGTVPGGKLPWNGAVLSAQPSAPGGTASGTPLMMGLGVTTCRVTPSFSTRIEFEIFGGYTNSIAGTVGIRIAFGTGSGPANAAAAAGTTFGSVLALPIIGSTDTKFFKNGGIITGLTATTTYWFDIQLNTTAGTANIVQLTCNAKEI